MKKSEQEILIRFMEMTIDHFRNHSARIAKLESILRKKGEDVPSDPDIQESERKLDGAIQELKKRKIVW